MTSGLVRSAVGAVFLLAAGASLSGCANIQAFRLSTANNDTRAELVGDAPRELRMQPHPHYIVLRARVNGKADVDLLLDTGAGVMALFDTPDTAPLGLDTRGARRLGSTRQAGAPTGALKSGLLFDFGGLRLHDQTVLAIPLASTGPCSSQFRALGVDGVIGYDLFRRFVVEVDPAARIVRLHDPDRRLPGGPQLTSTHELPFELARRKPVVKATWTGGADGRPTPLNLLVDTGYTGELTVDLGGPAAIAPPADAVKSRPSCLLGGSREGWTGPPTTLAFGQGLTLSAATRYIAQQPDSNWNGALGAALLTRYRLLIDYPNRRLGLTPLGPANTNGAGEPRQP